MMHGQKNFKLSVCLYSCLIHPVCKEHAPYVICDLPGFTTFIFHITPQTARFSEENKVIQHKMCVSIFSTTFLRTTSHSKKNSARYYHKCTQVFM